MHNLGDAIDCCLSENKIKKYTQCQIALVNLPDDPIYGVYNKTCTHLYSDHWHQEITVVHYILQHLYVKL